ncbi:MAG: biopolymer transporter ExbD [Gemmataceae bacterium]
MAASQKLLDVWILDGNTVYKDVPFAVVADWLQQGRLLSDDRVRLAGGQKWLPLIEVGAFAPYLPRSEPMDAEDTAEAMEPVELEVAWGKRRDEDDDDVDMIPLIDISLVLLIFFMMTASVASGIISPINTPPAEHQLAEIGKDMFWVGVDNKSIAGAIEKGPDGAPLPWFSFGDEKDTLLAPTTNWQDLARQMKTTFDPREGPLRIRIRGDVNLPLQTIQELTLELQGLEKQMNASRPGKAPLKLVILAEVSEPKRS